MLKKTALALATTVTLGLSALAVATPAQAGFWLDGVYVQDDRGWERHHCHWEVRRVQVWDHGWPHWVREQVRVCHHF